MLTLKLSAMQVLGLACFGSLLGSWIKRRAPVLDRWNIPAPIVGGLVFAVATLVMRDRWLNLDADMMLRDVLSVAFFTTIGMSASWKLLREGGRQVALFLASATFGLLLQMLLGTAMATALGLPPLLGIIPGAVSLTGGPATSLAFGPTFEQAGVTGATAVALASAVFGIVMAGLLSGFVGGRLIDKHKLRPSGVSLSTRTERGTDASPLLRNVLVLGLAMGAGTLVSGAIEKLGVTLPAYIGAMIVAAIVRNLDDHFHIAGISQPRMVEIGGIALDLFIVMAMLTLRLWELAHLALPVLLILIAQVALTVALCRWVVFRLMGRNHEAAVMAGGYCGFMLGTTANAMASMEQIADKYGPAPQAFFVVSIVGGFLIDFVNALFITQSIHVLK